MKKIFCSLILELMILGSISICYAVAENTSYAPSDLWLQSMEDNIGLAWDAPTMTTATTNAYAIMMKKGANFTTADLAIGIDPVYVPFVRTLYTFQNLENGTYYFKVGVGDYQSDGWHSYGNFSETAQLTLNWEPPNTGEGTLTLAADSESSTFVLLAVGETVRITGTVSNPNWDPILEGIKEEQLKCDSIYSTEDFIWDCTGLKANNPSNSELFLIADVSPSHRSNSVVIQVVTAEEAADDCKYPYVIYQGKCVDPIPACENPPQYFMPSSCVDKIVDGKRTERFSFNCLEGYVRSGSECVLKSNYQPSQTNTTPIPPAGYEDEVIINPEAYKNPFPDTNTSHLEGKAAAELYRRAVIGGYPDGEFKGSRAVNRAEAAKFLLLAKLKSVGELTNTGKFPDVVEGQWYVKFIIKAANLGIINGYPDGNFRPQNTVNTAEFLKMLTLTFGLEKNLDYSYSDVKSSDWFAQYAGAAQKYELFPSRSLKLEPAKTLTRDEVAVAIYQYLKNR